MARQDQQSNQSGSSERGFAAMDPEQQREIASQGGRAAHESGNAHEFDSEEARRAGQKGGEAVSEDREHMAEIGRKGGEARADSGSDRDMQASGGGNRGGGNRGGGQSQERERDEDGQFTSNDQRGGGRNN